MDDLTAECSHEHDADQPRYGSGYGLVLALRGTDPVTLPGTAPRFSVAAAQVAALRRWAGLEN